MKIKVYKEGLDYINPDPYFEVTNSFGEPMYCYINYGAQYNSSSHTIYWDEYAYSSAPLLRPYVSSLTEDPALVKNRNIYVDFHKTSTLTASLSDMYKTSVQTYMISTQNTNEIKTTGPFMYNGYGHGGYYFLSFGFINDPIPDINYCEVRSIKVYDVDEYELDTYDDTQINLNFLVNDILNFEEQSSFSYELQLPLTTNNLSAFGLLNEINTVTDTIFDKLYDVKLYDDLGLIYYDGNIAVTNASTIDTDQYISVNITSKTVSIKDSVGDDLIYGNEDSSKDLNLESLNHIMSRGNLVNYSYYNYSSGSGYCYPLVDNGIINGIQNTYYMKPAVFIKTVFDQIFQDSNLIYSSSFLNSDYFKTLLFYRETPINLEENVKDVQKLECTVVTYSFNDTVKSPSLNPPLPFNYQKEVYFHPDSITYLSSGSNYIGTFAPSPSVPSALIYTCAKSGYYNIEMQISGRSTLKNTSTSVYPVEVSSNTDQAANRPIIPNASPDWYLYMRNTPRIFYNGIASGVSTAIAPTYDMGTSDINYVLYDNHYAFSAQEVLSGSLDHNVLISKNNYLLHNNDSTLFFRIIMDIEKTIYYEIINNNDVEIEGTYALNPGSYFKIYRTEDYVVDGDIVRPIKIFSDIKKMDFIKSIFSAFNLVWSYDTLTKTIIIEPYNDFYNDEIVDWTSKVDWLKEQKISGVEEIKSIKFTSPEDTDEYNVKYKTKYDSIFGSRVINNQKEGTDLTIETIFAPTHVGYLGGSPTLNFPVAKTFKYKNGEVGVIDRDYVSKPRLLQTSMQGVRVSSFRVEDVDGGASVYVSGSEIVVATPFDNNYSESLDLNWNVGLEYEYPTDDGVISSNNLYNRYYRQMVEDKLSDSSKKLECTMMLNALDIANLDFRKKVLIDNNYYMLQKIGNWNYDTKSCTVTLIKTNYSPLNVSHINNYIPDTIEVSPGSPIVPLSSGVTPPVIPNGYNGISSNNVLGTFTLNSSGNLVSKLGVGVNVKNKIIQPGQVMIGNISTNQLITIPEEIDSGEDTVLPTANSSILLNEIDSGEDVVKNIGSTWVIDELDLNTDQNFK